MNKLSTNQKGFTLIELLVVISVIAALGVAVFVALDPAKRLKDARDAKRTTDVDTILSAIHASIVDSKGTLPTALQSPGYTTGTEVQIGTAATGCAIANAVSGCDVTAAACVDLTKVADAQNLNKYLKTMPADPLNGTQATTKYSVTVDTNGLVTVKACGVEGTTGITASR